MKAILLTQDQVTFVDDGDYEQTKLHTWYAAKTSASNFYAQSKIEGKIIQLQRFLLSPSDCDIIDHRNRDTLDNRRINLRLADHRTNSRNSVGNRFASSKFKGVAWYKRRGKWSAYIGTNPKNHLGYFDKEIQAALAYDSAARELFGGAALTNFNHLTVPLITEDERREAISQASPRIVVHWRIKSTADSRNGRLTRHFEHEGENLTIRQWAIRRKINLNTLRTRIYARGMNIAQAVSQ